MNRCSEIETVTRQRHPGGFFPLWCSLQKAEDGLVEAECLWLAVKKLHDDGAFTSIKKCSKTESTACIYCNVTDCSDLQILINVAKRIYKITRFPSTIPFCINTGAGKSFTKYIFTPQGELYKQAKVFFREPYLLELFAFVHPKTGEERSDTKHVEREQLYEELEKKGGGGQGGI